MSSDKKSHAAMIKLVAAKGATQDGKDKGGMLPLHWAAQKGYYKHCLPALLSLESSVMLLNAPCSAPHDDKTPLHLAVENGHTKCVDLLLQAKAAVNPLDSYERETPLHYACQFSKLGCAELLLRNNADPSIASKNGDTALHYAVTNAHTAIITALLAAKADPNARTSSYTQHRIALQSTESQHHSLPEQLHTNNEVAGSNESTKRHESNESNDPNKTNEPNEH
jgi:ankyrin repeat protein